MRCLILVAGLLLSSAGWAAGGDPGATRDAGNPTLADIRTQQKSLRGDVANRRGMFKDVENREREQLLTVQDRVLVLTEGADRLEDLQQDDRIELFNALEQIKASVAKARDERKVCERSRIAGSNRYQVACMTAGEREALRQRTREQLGREIRCNASAAACVGD